jgi:hypothetical protein
MKPYLVMVPSLRGPQPQVWYKDGTRFVTPSDIVPIEPPIELPGDRILWAIDAAVAWAKAA